MQTLQETGKSKTVNIKSKKFDVSSHHKSYQVAIEIDLCGYAVAVMDRSNTTLVSLYEIAYDTPLQPSQIPSIVADLMHGDLARYQRIESIKIHFYASKFVLVPAQYYFFGNDRELLETQHKTIASGDQIFGDTLKLLNAQNIYSLPNGTANTVFANTTIQHAYTSLIETLLFVYQQDTQTHLFVNVRMGSADVIALQNGKLLLANPYDIHADTDLVYFLALICQELDFDTATTPINLMGNISNNDDLHTQIKQYFQKVNFIKQIPYLKYDPAFKDVSAHQHFSLMSLLACE